MAFKKKILDLKWSELSEKQKKNFKNKSDFISQKKPKKAATLAIQQDKGKLKPKDVKKIANETGLSAEKITKLTENKFPGKVIGKNLLPKKDPKPKKAAILAIEQDKGKLKPKDADKIANDAGLSIKKIIKLTENKFPDKVISKNLTIDKGGKGDVSVGGGKGDVSVGGGKGGDKKDTTIKDLKSDLEEAESKIKDFPGSDGKKLTGKRFRKYKPQAKKIRKAAEADLALRLEEGTKPKTLKKAEKIKTAFQTGREKREKQLAKISDVKRPKFKDYKQAVKDIRKGEGAAEEYAYSGKFEKLGKKLGVKYGEKAREERTKSRLADLKKNIGTKFKKTYKTATDDAESQRKKGRKAMKLFRGESAV